MQLGLGTAQFGMDYGVSNRAGRVSVMEVGRILGLAAELGVHTLDTAAAYGESESALGAALWPGHPFRIVTKCPPLDGSTRIAEHLHRSLDRLRQPSVYGLLMHRAPDLAQPGGERLAVQLAELKRQGLVKKIGVSFYTAMEIESARKLFTFDLAQVPMSIVDQRLIADGTLASMHADGIEVHARSVFLQGVLLMDAGRLPAPLVKFAPQLLRIERQAAEAKISKLELALGFAATVHDIDTVLVGVTSAAELRQVCEAWKTPPPPHDYGEFACDAEDLVNPSRWPRMETLSNA